MKTIFAALAVTMALSSVASATPYWELSWAERSAIQIENAVAKAKAERAAETNRPVGGGGTHRASR